MHVRDGFQAMHTRQGVWILSLLIVTAVFLFSFMQRNPDQPGSSDAAPETRPFADVVSPAAQALDLGTREVVAVGGRLGIHVENRSLEWILDRITREAEIAIVLNGNLADVFVSVQFSDLPIEEGLQRLLASEDTFFFHTGGALKVVWVYPATEGRGIVPVSPEEWASTTDLEKLLTHRDPDTRARVIDAVVERKGDEALDDVMWAIADKDDSVRTAALYAALGEIDFHRICLPTWCPVTLLSPYVSWPLSLCSMPRFLALKPSQKPPSATRVFIYGARHGRYLIG